MNALENRPAAQDVRSGEVATVSGVSKRFGDFTAVDDVSFTLRENTIYGLLGRNGAGKSTIMRMIAGHAMPTSGSVRVHGAEPFENDEITRQICFAAENQVYPEIFRVRDILTAGRLLYPNWDQAYADELMEVFNLPSKRQMKKLSRGMRSAVGIVVGLASRAPITIFDEPYLGLDATSRQLFYDRLIADYAENPRTIMLSTHLIDEVSELIEHVLVIDRGRLVIDQEADLLRGRAISVSGPTELVDKFSYAMTRIHEDTMLGQTRVTVLGDQDDPKHAQALGLDVKPVSLQQLVVQSTLQVNPEKVEVER